MTASMHWESSGMLHDINNSSSVSKSIHQVKGTANQVVFTKAHLGEQYLAFMLQDCAV